MKTPLYSETDLIKAEPILFIPQRLGLAFWVLSLLYSGLLAFSPVYAVFLLFKDAWRAGRIQAFGLPDMLVLLLILAVLITISWAYARWFFKRWHMARMDEFWARREGQFYHGITLTETGVEVCLFDEEFFIPKEDFLGFKFWLKRTSRSQSPYLHLHYMYEGKETLKELYWDDLLWHKTLGNLRLPDTYTQINSKQKVVDDLNQLVQS